MLAHFFSSFYNQLLHTQAIEFIAAITGIISVLYSRKAHVYTYPIGLISTLSYIIICLKASLFGESVVNLFYSIMGVYGWYHWKSKSKIEDALPICYSTKKQHLQQLLLFGSLFLLFFCSLTLLKNYFSPDTIPFADALASAAAFTGMYLMTQKKVESWYWWLLTNIVCIPLYYVKGYAFTSVQYGVFTILTFYGLKSWKQYAEKQV
ncbi:MAG: nicotinamide riboside transporter PnuC [Bacteroidota bacterium]|mgnify:FL=1|jgi:nicotinamide mononucleotide transporter